MFLLGADFLKSLVVQGGFEAKMVLNAKGAIFFAVNQQHRSQKVEGISYEDNYKGNALAAMLTPGKVEIRYHKDFSDERVATIMRALLAQPALSFMREWQVTYQGRRLSLG